MPMPHVAELGVRERGWLFAKRGGIARYAPIDRAARAVGKIVVCVDAADDVSTEMIRRITKAEPTGPSPKTAGPTAANMSLALSGLPRPMPVVPVPANATEATAA